MTSTVILLLLGVLVAVSSIPLPEDNLEQQNAIAPKPLTIPKIIEKSREDSLKTGTKDVLEGAESAYLAYPFYFPFVHKKYPVILYGK